MKLTRREKRLMNEAFMVGRIYHAMGEKESPSEIHEKLIERCIKAVCVKN